MKIKYQPNNSIELFDDWVLQHERFGRTLKIPLDYCQNDIVAKWIVKPKLKS